MELLTVVAILSLLSTSMLASLELVRQKARDARRLEDINSMITALQLYYDTEGKFPCHNYYSSENPDFLSELVDRGYLQFIPKDPVNTSNHAYWYTSWRDALSDPPCSARIAHLDIDFETSDAVCPFGKFKITAPQHCHIYYPHGLPCTFPYSENNPNMLNEDPTQLCSVLSD